MREETKVKLGIGAVVTGITAAATLMCFSMVKLNGYLHLNDRRVAALVERYKACPDRYRTSCMSEEEANKTAAIAKAHEDRKEFAMAGLSYARLGMFEKALAMADSCERHGQRRWSDSVSIETFVRQDAITKYEESEARPPSSPQL